MPPPPPHFGWPKMNFDRISRHFRSIRNFLFFFNFFFTKWLPAAILDDRKSLSIAFLTISDQYSPFIFWNLFTKWLAAAILDDQKSLSIAFLAISDQYATFFSTKWLPAAILDDRKSLSNAFLAISDQYATFMFFSHKMATSGHFGWPKITFDHISRHFRSIRNFYLKKKEITKWLPATILDDRKSLSNAFLAISYQYATFILELFFKMAAVWIRRYFRNIL